MRKTINIPITKDDARYIWYRWKRENKITYENFLTECALCRSKDELGIHHKDGDKSNNNLENHICLCYTCHRKIHAKEFQIRYKVKEIIIETEDKVIEKTTEQIVEETMKKYKWFKGNWVRR